MGDSFNQSMTCGQNVSILVVELMESYLTFDRAAAIFSSVNREAVVSSRPGLRVNRLDMMNVGLILIRSDCLA